jgi:hypothetical protein
VARALYAQILRRTSELHASFEEHRARIERDPERALADEDSLLEIDARSDEAQRLGWCLAVLESSASPYAPPPRREPEGLRWLLEQVAVVLAADRVRLQPDALTLPRVSAAADGGRLALAVGALVLGAARGMEPGSSLRWRIARADGEAALSLSRAPGSERGALAAVLAALVPEARPSLAGDGASLAFPAVWLEEEA